MTDPILPGLRESLVEAAARRRPTARPSRAWRLAAAAAVVAVAAIALGALGGSEPAAAGVDIEVRDGVVEVTLTDIETRPDVVEDALRDAGIDAEVVGVPMGPSLVGRFVSSGAVDPALQPVLRDGSTFRGFQVPEGHPDPLELRLGRPAAPGEAYLLTSDAYAAGEPLSCLGIRGSRLSDVPDLVPAEVHVRVQPFVEGVAEGSPVELDAAATSTFADLLAADAIALSATDVLVNATVDGRSPFVDPPGSDDRCGD